MPAPRFLFSWQHLVLVCGANLLFGSMLHSKREKRGKRENYVTITLGLSVARVRGPRGAGGRECVPEAEPVAVCVGCARPPPPGAPGPRAARRPMTDRQPRAACLCPGTRQPTRSIRSEDRSVHAHTHTVHMPLAPPHLNTSTAPHTKSQSHHSRPLSPSTAVSSRHNTSTQGQCHSHRTTYHTHNRRFTGYTALAV